MAYSFRRKKGFFSLLLLINIFFHICYSNLNQLNWIQQIEFSFFDNTQVKLFSSTTPPASPIIIVGITEKDIQDLKFDTIDDRTLATLITKIIEQKPTNIGLDIIRDLPVGEGIEQLEEIYHSTDNLYGVGKFTGVSGDAYFQKIAPPPILEEKGKIGDVSIMVDDDGVVRRGNLFPTTGENGVPSLGLILAHDYLTKNGYEEKTSPSKDLQIGKTVFHIFNSNDGGYNNADDSGYQILMNWYHPPQSFQTVSISDVLSGNINDNLFLNKIVLIGYYTVSVKKDYFYNSFHIKTNNQTPRKVFGVEIHANLISYLINTVTNKKPLLKAVPNSIESVILTVWITLTGILIWLIKKIKAPLVLITTGLAIAVVLTSFCYYINYRIFILGWWLPIFPTIGIIVTTILCLLYILRERNLEHIENLELKIKERTSKLESAIYDLKQQQKLIIEQEKLAFLGRLTAGFCHQFKNPLYALKYNFNTLSDLLSEIDIDGENASDDIQSISEIIADLQEPIDKLELLFKLILISPTRKNIVWLNANANDFVKSITNSCLRFKFLDRTPPSIPIEIKYKLDDALNKSISIPQQLEIPIFNIIDNALDALLNRQEKKKQPIIIIETIKNDREWNIVISDNGGGISQSILQSIFEPFITTKPETHGIGLGLWISHEILVKIIGGDISVTVESLSTVFTLTVPFKQPI